MIKVKRFEILPNIQVFCLVTLCRRASSGIWTAETLKMKALRSIETSGTSRPTAKSHIPEDLNNYQTWSAEVRGKS